MTQYSIISALRKVHFIQIERELSHEKLEQILREKHKTSTPSHGNLLLVFDPLNQRYIAGAVLQQNGQYAITERKNGNEEIKKFSEISWENPESEFHHYLT